MTQVFVILESDNHPKGGGEHVLGVYATMQAAEEFKRKYDSNRESPDDANRWLYTCRITGPFRVKENETN